jgi:hypothetical protein
MLLRDAGEKGEGFLNSGGALLHARDFRGNRWMFDAVVKRLWGQVLQSHISKNKKGVIHKKLGGNSGVEPISD